MWGPVQRQETLASYSFIIIIIFLSAYGKQAFLPKVLEHRELVRNPQRDPSPLSNWLPGWLGALATQEDWGGWLARGPRGLRAYKPRVVRNLGPNLLQEVWPKIRQHHHYPPQTVQTQGLCRIQTRKPGGILGRTGSEGKSKVLNRFVCEVESAIKIS